MSTTCNLLLRVLRVDPVVGTLLICSAFGFDSTGLGSGTDAVKMSNKFSSVKQIFVMIFVKDE